MNEDLVAAVEAVTQWLDQWAGSQASQIRVIGPDDRAPPERVRWTLHPEEGPPFHLCFDHELLASEEATRRMLAELEVSGWMEEVGERGVQLVVVRGGFKPNSHG